MVSEPNSIAGPRSLMPYCISELVEAIGKWCVWLGIREIWSWRPYCVTSEQSPLKPQPSSSPCSVYHEIPFGYCCHGFLSDRVLFRKALSRPRSWIILPGFVSNDFTIPGLALSSLIHSELTLVHIKEMQIKTVNTLRFNLDSVRMAAI